MTNSKIKPIFSPNEDYNKSSFLNWNTNPNNDIENILVLAHGFLASSIELINISLINNNDKKADFLIFPILTNANHGIELYLKALCWTLNKLTNSHNRIEGSHNIKQILDTIKSKILNLEGSEALKYFNNATIDLHNYIDELFKKIEATQKQDKMDFSRYPLDNKYSNHFYVKELGNIEIDLENLLSRIQIIFDSLEDRASYYFYHKLQGN
ncbi:hypothetical protein [Myroides sp. DW712]|uniref:hypothetical protein n=1 Tax=Myroides sp. DW712 TaxID=3389800 RepID=UPI00397BCC55